MAGIMRWHTRRQIGQNQVYQIQAHQGPAAKAVTGRSLKSVFCSYLVFLTNSFGHDLSPHLPSSQHGATLRLCQSFSNNIIKKILHLRLRGLGWPPTQIRYGGANKRAHLQCGTSITSIPHHDGGLFVFSMNGPDNALVGTLDGSRWRPGFFTR